MFVRLHWQVRKGQPRLLLFFNGWGMDERLLGMIEPPAGRDLLAVCDYTDLQGADAVRAAVARYPAADLVAWSMGVWAAATVFGSAGARFDKAVAVNGTGRPIDDEYGIPAGLFHATLDNFSERARDSFFRRMCDGRDACGEFLPHAPLRDVEDQRRELLALARDAGAGVQPPGPFTSAVVGTPRPHHAAGEPAAVLAGGDPLPDGEFAAPALLAPDGVAGDPGRDG